MKKLLFILTILAVSIAANAQKTGLIYTYGGDSLGNFNLNISSVSAPTVITKNVITKNQNGLQNLAFINDIKNSQIQVIWYNPSTQHWYSKYINYGTDSIINQAGKTYPTQTSIFNNMVFEGTEGNKIDTYVPSSTAKLITSKNAVITGVHVVLTSSTGNGYCNIWAGSDSTGTLIGKFPTSTAGVFWDFSKSPIKCLNGIYAKQAATGSVGSIRIDIK